MKPSVKNIIARSMETATVCFCEENDEVTEMTAPGSSAFLVNFKQNPRATTGYGSEWFAQLPRAHGHRIASA